MTKHSHIAAGAPVSNDPNRALVEAWLDKNQPTVCPPDRRVAPKKPAPKANIERVASDSSHVRATDRSGLMGGPRLMSIQQALSWAFCAEKATLDFDQYGAHEFDREGIDPLWRGIQMQELGGVMIYGSSGNDPAADAAIIAGAVEALPIEHGGRKMAVQIAELSRENRAAPDWGQGERLACVPCGWDRFDTGTHAPVNKHGSVYQWRDNKYRKRKISGEFCPVTYTGTARLISAKRRNYLLWIGALMYLQYRLAPALHTIRITDALPEMAPWKRGLGDLRLSQSNS